MCIHTPLSDGSAVPDAFDVVALQELAGALQLSHASIQLRTAGFVFDMFTSNVDMDRHPEQYPLEQIPVPTLVIHAVDDPLAKYENAHALAERVPGARLVSIPSGGHLLLGNDAYVQSEIGRFLHVGSR